MNNKTIAIKEYIEKTKQFNRAEETRDKRISFTYNPKLHKILMTEHEQYIEPPFYSHTKVYELLEKRLSIKLSKLSPEHRKQFILDHIDEFTFKNLSIAFMQTSVGCYLHDETFDITERTICLDNIFTTPEKRNCGIGTMLINQAKNSCLVNNLDSISGQIVPLDAKAYMRERNIDKLNNFLAYNLGLMKKNAYIDMHSLSKIYDKMGFDVYKVLFSDLKIWANKIKLSEKEKLPTDIVTFDKKAHDEFFII